LGDYRAKAGKIFVGLSALHAPASNDNGFPQGPAGSQSRSHQTNIR